LSGLKGWMDHNPVTRTTRRWSSSRTSRRGPRDDPVGYDNIWLQYLDTPVLNLSEAGEGLTLTFDAWWLLEDPRIKPPPDPYDGWDGWLVLISENGGEDFEVIEPEEPGYSAELLSSADRFWDIGEWPGWVFISSNEEWPDTNGAERPDVDWVECSFDLSEYAAEDIVIRFALVTDRLVAAPFNIYLQESGVLIDNILIADDDERVFLRNNADGDPEPEELIPGLDERFGGDHWELTSGEGRQHSGDWSMWHDDDWFQSVNTLDSPPIELPEGLNLWFQFWVWCDMPDYDSDGNNQLDDFYQIYLSDDEGETWQYQCHDYARPESGGNGWAHYVPGIPFGETANVDLDLTEWAGETIQLRWWFYSDVDHDDGNGNGLFLDDIEVMGDNRLQNDLGMENLYVPYPATVDFRLEGLTVDMHNYGIEDHNNIFGWWGWISGDIRGSSPILDRPDLASGESVMLQLTDLGGDDPGWTPEDPGIFTVWARTTLDGDDYDGNDTAFVYDVRVWPEGLFELGYDNRAYSNTYNFEPGSGPMTRFSPGDGDLEVYSLAMTHFRFNGGQEETATFTLHIFGAGEDEQTPGEELLSMEVDVPSDSCLPNHMSVPLYDQEALRGLEGDFWVWVEQQQEDHRPQIIFNQQRCTEGHHFTFDGENATSFDGGDFLMHALVMPGSDVAPDLTGSRSQVDFGEVFVGASDTRSLSLYAVGLEGVTIDDVRVDHEAFFVDWPGQTTIHAGQAVTFDIIYAPHDVGLHDANLIIESNDEEPPLIVLFGSGALGVEEPGTGQPVSFGLAEPYPNPFNNETRVAFGLETAGETSLALYDLSGRRMVTLSEGWRTSGRHIVLLRGDALPAGVYLLKLEAGSKSTVRKVALVK